MLVLARAAPQPRARHHRFPVLDRSTARIWTTAVSWVDEAELSFLRGNPSVRWGNPSREPVVCHEFEHCRSGWLRRVAITKPNGHATKRRDLGNVRRSSKHSCPWSPKVRSQIKARASDCSSPTRVRP